ncbi:MAG: phosphodiester glycosidase family protein [Nitrospinae bacterium]|nr:phosphodiester glycosidase family protein [Nitrospinota bacterium]
MMAYSWVVPIIEEMDAQLVFSHFGTSYCSGLGGVEGHFAMKRLLVLILLIGSFGVVQPAKASTDCPLKGHPVGDGRWMLRQSPRLDARDVRIRFENGATARMKAIRLRHRDFTIRLHWRDKSKWSSPFEFGVLGDKLGAAIILNAGYYDEKGRPLGYFRSGGKVFNSRVLYRGHKTFLHYGALFTVGRKTGVPNIVSREKFKDSDVKEAFQAGPLLVADGKPVRGLTRYREYLRATRRTVVGLDAEGRLVVLVSEAETRGISWCELQEFLVLPESKGGLGIRDAMNLDGGSSSQLWVRGEVGIPGRPAPTYIIIAPRA